MIVAFSTSSPWTSVAAIREDGHLLWSRIREAPRKASQTCMEMLEELQLELGPVMSQATMFCADIGPGSFTGTRVGVVLAKTLSFTTQIPVAGASAFDLISPDQTVVFPSKRGEYFVRRTGEEPIRTVTLPHESFVGFGFEGEDEPPDAARFDVLIKKLERQTAESFLPHYLIEPSISLPNKPFAEAR